MIVSSRLNHRIVIERQRETVDQYRQRVTTWTEVASVRAEIVTASLTELTKPFGEEDRSAVVFRVRHRGDILTADRIQHAGRLYNIRELVELERRRGLELRCEAT
ncbi:phage head closure protein [Aureimonas altamirensis]|uniref:phage head closure protein n=1 Tax=Aureimonas altamirensis TaxID=370622 RepID=UPI0020370771|nr:phage head closure protein [Aureimonas altamirensis]MCM2504099.1 phage head closure protein [Aureimonas altamirensis]